MSCEIFRNFREIDVMSNLIKNNFDLIWDTVCILTYDQRLLPEANKIKDRTAMQALTSPVVKLVSIFKQLFKRSFPFSEFNFVIGLFSRFCKILFVKMCVFTEVSLEIVAISAKTQSGQSWSPLNLNFILLNSEFEFTNNIFTKRRRFHGKKLSVNGRLRDLF